MSLTKEDGKILIQAAREGIEYFFEFEEVPTVLKTVDLDAYSELRGVFVTLKKKGELRGCIGFPLPTYKLGDAVVKASISAAFEDYRFSPLKKDELKDITIELSVLSIPEIIEVDDPSEYLKKIKIGRDGLIIEYLGHTGLLLPQVPEEQDWTVEEYLEGLCMKAGLPPGSWSEEGVVLKSFQAQIFEEEK